MRPLLLRCCCLLTVVWGSGAELVGQRPEVVEVSTGSNVTMSCLLEGLSSYCYTVTWLKLDVRSGSMRAPGNTRIEPRSVRHEVLQRSCPVTIHRAAAEDSGVYYCAVASGQQLYFGNGTTVIVKETGPVPTVEVLVPWHSDGPGPLSLLCLVSGVVPSQVRVSWLVDGREEGDGAGLTTSTWTRAGRSAAGSTQSWLVLGAGRWARGAAVTCVVQVEGRSVSTTVQRKDDVWTGCYVIVSLYRTLAVASVVLLLVTLTAWATLAAKARHQDHATN